MSTITKKNIAQLRSIAMTQKAVFQYGKEGISANFIHSVNDYLENHELVKISVQQSVEEDIKTISLDIAGPLKAIIVQIIGRKIVLYRHSKKDIIKFE
jgi:RNA-binding protein